jgi:hypothetical protein
MSWVRRSIDTNDHPQTNELQNMSNYAPAAQVTGLVAYPGGQYQSGMRPTHCTNKEPGQ